MPGKVRPGILKLGPPHVFPLPDLESFPVQTTLPKPAKKQRKVPVTKSGKRKRTVAYEEVDEGSDDDMMDMDSNEQEYRILYARLMVTINGPDVKIEQQLVLPDALERGKSLPIPALPLPC